jgi:heme A synthase
MVTLSGLPHLRNTHELAGVAAGVLVIITITIGYLIKRINKSKNVIRMSHRWLGRISIVLVAINIVLGLLLLSVILRR